MRQTKGGRQANICLVQISLSSARPFYTYIFKHTFFDFFSHVLSLNNVCANKPTLVL